MFPASLSAPEVIWNGEKLQSGGLPYGLYGRMFVFNPAGKSFYFSFLQRSGLWCYGKIARIRYRYPVFRAGNRMVGDAGEKMFVLGFQQRNKKEVALKGERPYKKEMTVVPTANPHC
ncbi:MAG: hypothetical protein PUB21_11025 [Bacteroidales bacterium]|nr:hypothetical protein [Bacteroidales bacterium]